MKDPRFNKAIKEIKNISMTPVEKQVILGRIMKNKPISKNIGEIFPVRISTKSPWTVYSFGTWIQTHRWVSALAILVIVIVSGNSAVLASYDSLPGDAFYPIKVNLVEPIRVALATTPTAKAEIQTELVQNRLEELETLAARGQLDSLEEQKINELIEKQVSDLVMNIDEIKSTSPEKADDINTTLEASMNTHIRILDVIAISRGENRSKKSKSTETVPATGAMMAPVSAPTAPIVPVTTTVQNNDDGNKPAIKETEPNFTKSKTKNQSNSNKNFSAKKASVTSLIETTIKDLIATTSTFTSSLLQETITNEAHANLERAQKKLQEADNHNQNSDAGEAYSALIDSERSTKEAALFIKAKVRLEKEEKNEEVRKSSNGNSDN